jgi:hypothetical protein
MKRTSLRALLLRADSCRSRRFLLAGFRAVPRRQPAKILIEPNSKSLKNVFQLAAYRSLLKNEPAVMAWDWPRDTWFQRRLRIVRARREPKV